MRPEFLKFIRGLFKKAIKNQDDAVIKKNKIKEILEIFATDKKVAEAIMTPETEKALGYLVEEDRNHQNPYQKRILENTKIIGTTI